MNTRKNQSIVLNNTSPISASFMIKSSKNHKLNFETAVLSGSSNNSDVPVSLKLGHPVVTNKGNKILCDISHMTLEPHQKCSIDITVDCITEETVHEEIEIMVKDSNSLFVQVHGEI